MNKILIILSLAFLTNCASSSLTRVNYDPPSGTATYRNNILANSNYEHALKRIDKFCANGYKITGEGVWSNDISGFNVNFGVVTPVYAQYLYINFLCKIEDAANDKR